MPETSGFYSQIWHFLFPRETLTNNFVCISTSAMQLTHFSLPISYNLSYLLLVLELCSSVKHPYLPLEGEKTPHLSGNFDSTSQICLIFLVFENPPPQSHQELSILSVERVWIFSVITHSTNFATLLHIHVSRSV